jgi:hypothetical protein
MSTKSTLKLLLIPALVLLFVNFTSKDKDPLGKRKYDVTHIEVKDGKNSPKGTTDEFEFKDGKMFSNFLYEKFEYKWMKYKVTKDSAYIDETETEIDYIEVECSYTDDQDQTMTMIAKIDNYDIEGEIKITKKDKLKKMFVFNGKEKYNPKREKEMKKTKIK